MTYYGEFTDEVVQKMKGDERIEVQNIEESKFHRSASAKKVRFDIKQ